MKLTSIPFIFFCFVSSSHALSFIWPKKLNVEFTQEIISEISQEKIQTFGKISYQHPQQIRFEILRPSDQRSLFVSDGKKAWFYTPPFDPREKGELSIKDPKEVPFGELFTLLIKHGDKSNTEYLVKKTNNSLEFSFKSKIQKSLKLKKVTLNYKTSKIEPENLKSLVLDYLDNKNSVILVNKINQPKQFPAKEFIYSN